jgi:hypothetical protein
MVPMTPGVPGVPGSPFSAQPVSNDVDREIPAHSIQIVGRMSILTQRLVDEFVLSGT